MVAVVYVFRAMYILFFFSLLPFTLRSEPVRGFSPIALCEMNAGCFLLDVCCLHGGLLSIPNGELGKIVSCALPFSFKENQKLF